MDRIVVMVSCFSDELEAGGNAVVRVGLHEQLTGSRILLLQIGAGCCLCYGVTLNLVPFDFGPLIGAYVATFFVMGQVHTDQAKHEKAGQPALAPRCRLHCAKQAIAKHQTDALALGQSVAHNGIYF